MQAVAFSLQPHAGQAPAATNVPSKKLVQVAKQFEAVLLNDLLGPMEKTFSSVPGQKDSPGSADYAAMGAQALSSGLAASGGFGIANLIIRNVMQHQKVTAETLSAEKAKVPSLAGR